MTRNNLQALVMLPYFQLLRLPNLFTAISNILAAFLIGGGGLLLWPELLLLCLGSACLYSAGMVLNDCFDLEEDRLERPQRPLPAGQIPKPVAWMLGWGLLGLGIAFSAAAGERSLLTGLLLAGAIVLYNGWAKKTAIGILAMGSCRYLNWLLGFSVTATALPDALLLASPIFFYTAGLTALSKIETTGGSKGMVVLCAAGMLVAAAMILLLNHLSLLSQTPAMLLMAAGLGLILQRLWRLHQDPSPATIQNAVGTLVLGIIPLDALLVLNGAAWWGAMAVAFLIIPSKLLARRMYVT